MSYQIKKTGIILIIMRLNLNRKESGRFCLMVKSNIHLITRKKGINIESNEFKYLLHWEDIKLDFQTGIQTIT